MAFSPIAILACLLSVPVLAGSSLDYSLEPAVLDGGGAGGSSSEYTLIPSIGAGIASASENYELSGGYAGQLIDTNAPVITVTGENPTTVELGAAYTELGATADGGETVTIIGTVDTDTVGTYIVTYDVSDAGGNPATQVTREVIVTADATNPVITLVGGSSVSLELGTAYSDGGATAVDNRDGDITGNIVTVNPVNVDLMGTYTVTYKVSDAGGNAAESVSRTVVVE
ncbi:DUF5011 domain-containing protein, partial [Akkermansiaceae bacterium]|nr:DUF5011 domain-containing protein [Akkermansiaceae bacterium]